MFCRFCLIWVWICSCVFRRGNVCFQGSVIEEVCVYVLNPQEVYQ